MSTYSQLRRTKWWDILHYMDTMTPNRLERLSINYKRDSPNNESLYSPHRRDPHIYLRYHDDIWRIYTHLDDNDVDTDTLYLSVIHEELWTAWKMFVTGYRGQVDAIILATQQAILHNEMIEILGRIETKTTRLAEEDLNKIELLIRSKGIRDESSDVPYDQPRIYTDINGVRTMEPSKLAMRMFP
jgi:hypothetical protein